MDGLFSPPNLLRNVGTRPSFAQCVQATVRARLVPSQRFGVLARDLAHQSFAVFGLETLDRFRAHGWPVSSTPNLLRNVGTRPSFAQCAPATDRARPVPNPPSLRCFHFACDAICVANAAIEVALTIMWTTIEGQIVPVIR
jgi:hypothetical protein